MPSRAHPLSTPVPLPPFAGPQDSAYTGGRMHLGRRVSMTNPVEPSTDRPLPLAGLLAALLSALLVLGSSWPGGALAQGKDKAPPSAKASAAPGADKALPPDGVVRAQHGDWQIVCKPPPAGAKTEVCALVQSVTAEDRANVGLTVYFQRFQNGTRVLRVFAPLGVLLPPGLGLKVDGQDIGNAPFLRCHSFACYAQVVVEDELVEKLSKGKTAVFIIFQTEEAGIGIPISLKGFGEALAALN